MATRVRYTSLPRRLTKLYSENKRTYENLIQLRQHGHDISPLHLKLRIQKDRLIAWGIQWGDRSAAAAAQSCDIDGSLEGAGISDLVASIMSSIRELLDEAESLQPGVNLEVPAEYPAGSRDKLPVARWTPSSIQRLEEILQDLTVSIDTLCDLSRSRLESVGGRPLKSKEPPRSSRVYDTKPDRLDAGAPASIPSSALLSSAQETLSPSQREDLTDLAYIEPGLVNTEVLPRPAISSPPSYESIAAGSEDRVLAYISMPTMDPAAADVDPEALVMLDYRTAAGAQASGALRPSSKRFEKLLLALLKSSTWQEESYAGVLKLTGWTVDASRSRCAYVYQIPRTDEQNQRPSQSLQPRSLLSFLQNGGDADSNNVPCLEHRFRLALNIALSLKHLHESGASHGNVNSNNVLFFADRDSLSSDERIWKGPLIRKPYLTGFHQLGHISSAAELEAAASGIYHHPSMGIGPAHPFEFAHDYYSLGLVLLEIGLWMPVGKFLKAKYTRADFKARLQDIYMKKLASKCGQSYMNAVLHCMTAVDTAVDEGAVQSDLDGKALSRFERVVIRLLERCCLIDEDIGPMPCKESAVDGLGRERLSRSNAHVDYSIARKPAPSSSLQSLAAMPRETVPIPDKKTFVQKERKIKVWSYEIPPLYSSYWTSTMFPKLERILRRAISRWESYTIDIFMAGEDADTARPTVYMECTSTAKICRILRHLNKDLRLFDIKVVAGKVVRSKAGKKKRRHTQRAITEGALGSESAPGLEVQDLNPHYQEKPVCGASIGAYLNGSHLPPVSFGGTVLVDGEPFGMSVHHMLEDDDDIESSPMDGYSLQLSMAPHPAPKTEQESYTLQERFAQFHPFDVSSPAEEDDASSVGYVSSKRSSFISDPNSVPKALYPFEIFEEDGRPEQGPIDEDDEEEDFWLSPDFENTNDANAYEDEEDCDLGDTLGIIAGQGQGLMVTQPALDDVSQGFFPVEEEKDVEHLCSHAFGHVHASSGLRRARQDELIHEVDWALIKINCQRLPQPLNRLPSHPDPSVRARPDQYPLLPSANLANRTVHCRGRTSGIATGTILPSMRLVRMPGRISPSHSWQVRGQFGMGGDSGAWVIDSATGCVCGHVLAYSEASGVAYIAPMDVLLDDMGKVLGKEVRLPSQRETHALGIERTKSPSFPTSPPTVAHDFHPTGEASSRHELQVRLGRSLPGTGLLEAGARGLRARC